MQIKFDIDIVRIGYGFATISVEAESIEEAEQKALDEAGDHLYNEKTSEYSIVGKETPKDKFNILRELYKTFPKDFLSDFGGGYPKGLYFEVVEDHLKTMHGFSTEEVNEFAEFIKELNSN